MSLISEVYVASTAKYCAREAPLFVGLECEIESIIDHGKVNTSIFNITNDGSLRNNGYEYVSIPLETKEAVQHFRGLHASLVKGPECFSQRTSIHVHANCLNLESTEVRSIVLAYALFEEAFFAMVEKDRRHNIHCVPLTETFLPSYYGQSLDGLINRWHKYTALNLKPLTKYGTLEFRHMHGNSDLTLMTEWLSCIEKLFEVGRSTDVKKTVLDEKALEQSFNAIFGATRLADKWSVIRPLMDNAIIDIKLIG
jgi:hypothetical protein